MDIFMRGVAQSASEDDVKLELAKILHKAPFPLDPVLNFQVVLFKKPNARGRQGILSLPNEATGRTFLLAYGTVTGGTSAGVLIKGSRVLFCKSKLPLNVDRVAILNSRPWRDPRQLQREKEERIREGRPYELTSYAFGRFLPDGSFSTELFVDGSANIACDLERRQIRFTLRKQSRPFDDDDDGSANIAYDLERRQIRLTLRKQSRPSDDDDDDLTSFVSLIESDLGLLPSGVTTALYPVHKGTIEALIDSECVEEDPTLFIKANAFPYFATEFTIGNDRIDARRAQGLVPDVQMPEGCFSLACTFVDQADKDAFMYAAHSRFHIRVSHKTAPIRVEDNLEHINVTHPDFDEYLGTFPFELAFEIEKAVMNWTITRSAALGLQDALVQLCETYGDAAVDIFGWFVYLLEEGDEKDKKKPKRGRRSKRNRGAPTTHEDRLAHATKLYLEDQTLPYGRLVPALASPAVSYTYHLILTPTRHILEGPTADQSNSVLRRFKHNECFLRLTFQDEDRSKLRRDFDTSISELLSKRYRPVLLNGCVVAGRHYQMLGYSMSGLKEHSLWFVTPFYDEDGRYMDAETIRESLGDFSRLLYQPARLGARWSQAFSATDPSITLKPDEITTIPDIESPLNKMMTDGCSPISTELATAIWRANQKTKNLKRPARTRVPSAYQFRLGGAKGMVVQDPRLEGRVVCLRPSQIKFEAPDNRTFDIQSTSLRPKAMFLNRPLIVLLEFLGSSQHRILELQDRSIQEARSVRYAFLDAAKVLQQHGLGSSFHLPSLLRNMHEILQVRIYDGTEDSLNNDLIANTLHCGETHILRELKYRAHIAVPGSYTLLGVSDEWDCLAEGEIYATVYDDKRKVYEEITGEVAITRSPQIHPGDVQVVKAVRRDELKHLTNVVVFSCRGNRSLSSCLGGGDLDGDDFNIITDPKLIPTLNKTPGEYVSLPIKQTEHPCGIEDVVEFIFNYIEADLVGHIAVSHLRFSDLAEDELGPSCEQCLKLAELASQAVDFPKTGTPVVIQDLPRPRNKTRPDFLAREGSDLNSEMWYQSAKMLGQLFRRVPVKDWMPGEYNGSEAPSGGHIIERALSQVGLYGLGLSLEAPSEELQVEMDYLLDDYCNQLFVIGTTHTISKNKDIWVSESELVSGTIMANWSDHHRRREAVGSMNLQTHQLVRAVRMEMRASKTATHEESQLGEDEYSHMEWDDEEEYDDDDYYREARQVAETFRRAWAGWCAAEKALKGEPGSYGPQSFGLIALGRMMELIKAARLFV